MEIKHKIKYENNIQVVTLFVSYPTDYEFALDFDSFKKNVKHVSDNIKEYITKNFEGTKHVTFVLVLNGILIGTLVLTSPSAGVKDDSIITPPTYIESVEDNNNTQANTMEETNAKAEELQKASEEVQEPVITNTTEENKPETSQQAQINTPATTAAPKTTTPKTTTTTPSTPAKEENTTPKATGKTINVKLSSGSVINLSLDDYVIGVVGAEMPASFNVEALKAQSVAARTYALKATQSGATINANISDQQYKTNSELKSTWGSSYDTYYSKVKNAVLATSGEYLSYNGKYIEALYFSTSNGRTEDAVFVWGNSVPYLKSVESPWDVGIPSYSSTATFTLSQLSSKLGVSVTSVSQIKIMDKTTGDRVKTVSINSKTFTGVQIRTLLGLRSADFSVSANGSSVVFTCKGYGHGVGMSQYGANGMAKAGKSYSEILRHYYTGVAISKL